MRIGIEKGMVKWQNVSDLRKIKSNEIISQRKIGIKLSDFQTLSTIDCTEKLVLRNEATGWTRQAENQIQEWLKY